MNQQEFLDDVEKDMEFLAANMNWPSAEPVMQKIKNYLDQQTSALDTSLSELEIGKVDCAINTLRKSLGKCHYSEDGTLLNGDGTRSIFDDVDE